MRWWLALAALYLSAYAARSDDQTGVKWEELRPDRKVSAQMLCGVGLLTFFQEVIAQRHFPKSPIDDARERAIGRVAEFVVANSSQHPQMSAFLEMRQAIEDRLRKSPDRRTCDDPGFQKWFRDGDPAELDASFEKMLASPFDPNEKVPCGP